MSRIFSTSRLLSVLASMVVLFASSVGGHPLLAEAAWVAVRGAASSSSSPEPIPLHDEAECSFCKAGSAAYSATSPGVSLGMRVSVERTATPFRAPDLSAWQASCGAARAPPFDRLG